MDELADLDIALPKTIHVQLRPGGVAAYKPYRNKDGTRRYYLVLRWDLRKDGRRFRPTHYLGTRGRKSGYTGEEWANLCKIYNNRCARCGERLPLTVDHVVPSSRGGADVIGNIQPLCSRCNSIKGIQAVRYAGGKVEP